MIDWILDIYRQPTILEMFMFLICFSVSYLTIAALFINFIIWISETYKKVKDIILQVGVKTIHLKYDIYVVSYPSGEIFYVDKKRIRKLREKELIRWNNDLGRYVFEDKDTKKVKKVIKPLIEFYNSNKKIEI
jgi:hypothetical protein